MELLCLSANKKPLNAISDIKFELLVSRKIKTLRTFDFYLFIDSLSDSAIFGVESSCRLYACINWLEFKDINNKDLALRIWSSLGVHGDLLSIRMLMNALKELKQDSLFSKWTNVFTVLSGKKDNFQPIALLSSYKKVKKDDVLFANLITIIKQSYSRQEVKRINFELAQYVLDSKDNYETKMCRITSGANFYLVLNEEYDNEKKDYGF